MQNEIKSKDPGPNDGPGRDKPDDDHGRDFVSVLIDQVSKKIHRGNYTLGELKAALGVATDRELDIIENGKIRALGPDERITIKEGMEFVSRQPAGGAS